MGLVTNISVRFSDTQCWETKLTLSLKPLSLSSSVVWSSTFGLFSFSLVAGWLLFTTQPHWREKRSLDPLFLGVFSPPFTSECLFSLQLQLGLCAGRNSGVSWLLDQTKRYRKRFRLYQGAYLTDGQEESYGFCFLHIMSYGCWANYLSMGHKLLFVIDFKSCSV